ncbi:MAG TPA: ABC transporter substrate-binding protein [Dehalococcoidia bacterium]|nr:ABC transporter substrate-binding protein [Dehalococcoidia bacterium]
MVRRLTRRTALGAIAMSGSAVLPFACGGSKLGTKPSAATAPGGSPQRGGQINLRASTDPFDWDLSYVGKSAPNGGGMALAYNSLLGYKFGPGVDFADLTLKPALAEGWEVSPDATQFTFHLRRDVKFSNRAPVGGRELTSADVKWSYEYWSRTGAIAAKDLPKSQFDWFFEGLDAIETPDAYTVITRFRNPFVPFLSYAAADFNPIVPHELFDQYGSLKDHIAGSGAYQLDSENTQKGSRWVWKKNPDYWESGKPYIDEIRWLVIEDDAAAAAAFRSKQLDMLGSGLSGRIGFTQAQQVRRDNPTAVEYSFSYPELTHVWINTRHKPLDDLRVRQAISLSIDRDEFVKNLLGGQGDWALAGAFPDTFSQTEIRQMMRHDPGQARQLLAAAGYPSGLDIEMTYPGKAYGDDFITLLQLFQSQLKQGGINITLKSVDKDTESSGRKQGTYTISITPGLSLEGDIDSYLFQFFHPSSKANYGGLNEPKLAALIEAQRQEPDAAKRKDLVRQAVRYINADLAYNFGLFYPRYHQFWYPHVKNFAPNWGVSISNSPLTEAWVER